MDKLWNHRLTRHLKEIGKYSRLIINDHFSLILLIILAFGALFYRDLLGQLILVEPHQLRWVGAILFALVVGLVFYYGRPLWLTEDPDKSYLFSRGKDWLNYWLKGSLLGSMMPILLLVLVTAVMMPFVALATTWTLEESIYLMLTFAMYRLLTSLMDYLSIFALAINGQYQSPKFWMTLIFTGLVLVSSLLTPPFNWVILIGGLVLQALFVLIAMAKKENVWMDFEYVVETEELRQAQFYKWISVFADVPQVTPSVQRREYLDPLIGFLPWLSRDRYGLLFSRAILRNNAYSGVWIRVMLFTVVTILLTDSIWLILGMGLIGHLMTLIQLMPMLTAYRYQAFQRIYPYQGQGPLPSFQKVVLFILIVQSIVYAVAAIISVPFSVAMGMTILVWMIIAIFLVFLYVPWWEHKQNRY